MIVINHSILMIPERSNEGSSRKDEEEEEKGRKQDKIKVKWGKCTWELRMVEIIKSFCCW